MPIYLEARNVSDLGGAAGGHMYLVYVPVGDEENYNAWKTIGAFPTVYSSTGPWGKLDAKYLDSVLTDSDAGDEYGVFLEQFTAEQLAVMTQEIIDAIPTLFEVTEARGRQLIYSGADEAGKWGDLVAAATDLDDIFSYKAFTLTNNIHSYNTVFGPTVNSNSFMTSVLHNALGLDIDDYLPDPTPNSGISNDFYPGAKTRLGTENEDTLSTGANVNALYGGEGADIGMTNTFEGLRVACAI